MDLGAGGSEWKPCLSEGEASEFVRGTLSRFHFHAVEMHLDRCSHCLSLVAALADAFSSRASRPSSAGRTLEDITFDVRPSTRRLLGALEPTAFPGTERFQVVQRLGSGGMGVVYEALDRQHGTRIALKVLPTQAAEALLRFKNEFRSLQDLQHPNLVRMGELFAHDGHWFFTMELIDGVDFLRYVWSSSSSGRYDEVRLRSALRQLAVGLNALHAAGKVHRDIKPKNTLVTVDDRLVILDFGLVQTFDVSEATELHTVGTVAYMAPEQAASHPVGPAADWYSAGVMLFEALTGRLPFAGAPFEILADKQIREPPAVESFEPSAPADLAALCNQALRLRPQDRPDGAAVLRALGEAAHARRTGAAAVVATAAVPFVGRHDELARLHKAFGATTRGRAAVVIVEGESGIGKSALVREFTDRIRAERSDALILKARCYEREAVTYKAFDGILDALSRFLVRLPNDEVASLLPRWKTTLLAQAFPVLGRVEAVAAAPALEQAVVDPQERRGRVFSALRDLFSRLSERQPLVLVIDDLQWSDVDSLALLAELLRDPSPPALLLVATLRSGASETNPALLELPKTLQRLGNKVSRLCLERLSTGEARRLAAALLQRTSAPAGLDPRQLAEEARGHPLYIDELVRHHAAVGGGTVAALRLDEVLWSRVGHLDVAAHRLLAVIALAGGPLAQEAAALATGLSPNEFDRVLGALRVEHLARTTGAERSDLVECYHDRVREAVVTHLDAAEQRDIHRRLALALAASADAERLARHWHAAGEPGRAVGHAIHAAENAARAFAFDHAARLYEFALGLVPQIDPARYSLYAKLGDALANAGRGREAGQAYLSAVAGVSDVEMGLDLRRRAAEQFLVSGHIDDGLAVMRSVLAEFNLRLPASSGRALTSLLWCRARTRLRGLWFKRRDAREISARELERVDICQSVSKGLTLVDLLCAADFQARTVLLALEAGEPARICETLSIESTHLARVATSARARARAYAMLAIASELARQLGDPKLVASNMLAQGAFEFVFARWRRSLELCDEANRIFRDRCTGVWWQQNIAIIFSLGALATSGRLAELSERLALCSSEAAARGNLFLETTLHLRLGALERLAADDPEGARRQAEDALRRWSTAGFHYQHFQERLVQCYVDQYMGNGSAAYRCITEGWPSMKASHLLHHPYFAMLAMAVRARAAIMAAPLTSDWERLLREAAADAYRLRRKGMLWSEPTARLIDAGCAALRGQTAEARRDLIVAIEGFDQADMALEAAVARRRLAAIVGGDEGQALLAAGNEYMRRERVRCPERMMMMMAPGFRD